MAFAPVVNVNEKNMSREEVMSLLMDTYDKMEKIQGPDYCEITLRLDVWAGGLTNDNRE